MEKGLFRLICDRVIDWATRLQKACADNHETTLEQLIRGQSPRWWAWSLSWGFHGGRFVNGRPASQLPGVQEIRDTSATFAEVWTASSAVAILLHMTDLCNTHAHVLVLADYEAEERKIDPSEFYPGKWKKHQVNNHAGDLCVL